MSNRNAQEIRSLFRSSFFQDTCQLCDHPEAHAALPDASLDFLVALAKELKAEVVFEFGSGRSTRAFLDAGFQVSSLEGGAFWMDRTTKQLTPGHAGWHMPLVRNLRCRFHGLIPVRDWFIDKELAALLSRADLILVDAPYFAPFRESTLWSALVHGENAVVVLDDTDPHACENL